MSGKVSGFSDGDLVSVGGGGVVDIVIWSGGSSMSGLVVEGEVVGFSVSYLGGVEEESVMGDSWDVTVVSCMVAVDGWCVDSWRSVMSVVNIGVWGNSCCMSGLVVESEVVGFSVSYLGSVEEESVVGDGRNVTVVSVMTVLVSAVNGCGVISVSGVMNGCGVMSVDIGVGSGSSGMGSLTVESKVVSFGCSYLRSVLPRCQDMVWRVGSDGATNEGEEDNSSVHVCCACVCLCQSNETDAPC